MKYISLLLIFILVPTLLFPQTESEEDKEFLREKITISITRTGFGTYGSGIITYSEIKYWEAYKGFEKISEVDLFKLTGYEYEAQMAEQYHNQTMVMLGGGFFAMIIGTGLIVLDIINSENNSNLERIWPPVIFSGCLLDIIGSILIFASSFRGNWAPAEKAMEVAEEYNKKLREKYE